jgi:hypothetical protein
MINSGLRTAPLRDADGYGLAHYAMNCRVMTNGVARPPKDITDGAANTLLIGEVNTNFRPWGDPGNVRDPARETTLNTSPDPIARMLMLRFTAKACGVIGPDARWERIADALRDTPELSDRAIAHRLNTDGHRVAPVRRELERAGQILRLAYRRDAIGRPSPSRRPRSG